jgi:hypothetical protein
MKFKDMPMKGKKYDGDRGTIELSMCIRNPNTGNPVRRKNISSLSGADIADVWQTNRMMRKKRVSNDKGAATAAEAETILDNLYTDPVEGEGE